MKDLQEFKASVKEIGREPFVLSETGEVYDDMPLPDTEPLPLATGEGDSPPSEASAEERLSGEPSDIADIIGMTETSEETSEVGSAQSASGEEDFDFSSFLDSVTEEAFSAPTEPESEPEQEPEPERELEQEPNFSVPDDLLQGLSDEIEASRTETGAEPDILDLENLGGEELGFEGAPPEPQQTEAPAASAEPENFDFSMPEFEDVFSETGPSASAKPPTTDEVGELSSGEPSFDQFKDFSLGTETFEGVTGEPSADEEEAPLSGIPVMEDFSLAGIDELFTQNKETPRGQVPAGRVIKTPEVEGKPIEEITLSEEEYKQLEDTLASYPLNLRIACEELIAEEAVNPDQMAALVKMLVRGAPAQETASLASRILGRSVPIPKGFEKKTGEELAAEQASFAYMFRHRVLPILGLFVFALIVSASLFYLVFEFIYTPLRAESIYKKGYELIDTSDYQRANERFDEAFNIWQNKTWFFKYAEKFRDKEQYIYAEQKYEELLRWYPRDKEGALEFAGFEATYLKNYSKADRILRDHILYYSVDDKEGLLALGDVNLAWGDEQPERYEEARKAYARYMERYGWEDPVLERMLKYFIRTDNLAEVLPLQSHFMESERRKISGETLAEMGGYLLDKKLQDVEGVPDKDISKIEGVREVLERAIRTDMNLPEGYYHLARYYSKYGNTVDEQAMLEKALSLFEKAPELSGRRIAYHIDTYRRYALLLRNNREFISAQAQLNAGLKVYEDAVQRGVLDRSPEFGRLYADLGDIEYFVEGNYDDALQHYNAALADGWAPGEMQYRMGVIYYSREAYSDALEKFFVTSLEFPLNRRLLFALGNTTYMRGDYHAAQGYYSRLLDILETERSRFPMLVPHDRPEHMELVERLMMARNNLAATLENLADATGNTALRGQALGLYAESSRAWDLITRDPESMVRSESKNLAYLNTQNALYPIRTYERQIYTVLDKDVQEPSLWEELLQR